MTRRLRSFDRLASCYEGLERLAFGADLERARFCHLDHLRGCQRVLVLGEGDGRFLARALRLFPDLCIDCVDASSRMLALAKTRLDASGKSRSTFRRGNALEVELGENRYDAVVTLFFLDCFAAPEAAAIISKVRAAMRENALWLWADFAMPKAGWRRWRAELWLRSLYLFFGWQTGLSVRRLPPVERLFQEAGFRVLTERTFQAGMVGSAVFAKEAERK